MNESMINKYQGVLHAKWLMPTVRPMGRQSRGCSFLGGMIRRVLEGEVGLDPDFEGWVEFGK